MHELNIMVEVVRIVEETAIEQNIEKISVIVLQIGELSSVVPQYVEEYFPIIVDMKQMFKDTKLEIEAIPGIVKCQKCKTEFNVVEQKGYCPKCGSFDKEIISGEEFFIKEIVISETNTI